MEDFASVIWAVIIVGAMIFNVVSQSRKARGKGARQTPHAETKAPRHRAAERFRTAPEKDAIAAHAITDAPEEAATIAEEFDPRQAVIYSEILKSRFDEE